MRRCRWKWIWRPISARRVTPSPAAPSPPPRKIRRRLDLRRKVIAHTHGEEAGDTGRWKDAHSVEPRQALLSRKRVQQRRGARVLYRNRRGHFAASARSTADLEALPGWHRGRPLLREE